MAAPVFIAVNQTVSDIELVQLAVTVPASGSVTLSDYNTTSEIQDDAQLRSLIEGDSILLNDGTTTLTKAQSLQYMTVVTSPTPLNPMTTRGDVAFGGSSPAGSPTRLAGVAGAYLRSGGSAADPTFTRNLDAASIVLDAVVGATPNASAILQANSTTKGFLPPCMTKAQLEAVASPADGLMAYSTTERRHHFWDGTGWRALQATVATRVVVATDGSGDFTSIQDAIDSITDAATDKRYVIEISPGTYAEDVSLKDYITLNGVGWDSLIQGTVTATAPVEMTMVNLRVESTNAPAIIITGADPAGELDLLQCFVLSTWDDTVAGGVVRCTVHQDSGILYPYIESEFTLTVNDTVHTSGNTVQTIYHLTGTSQLYLESFVSWHELYTDNPGNLLCLIYNDNTHASSTCRVIGYGTNFWLSGTAQANKLHGIKNVGNGFYVLHDHHLYISADNANTVQIHVGCSDGAPAGGGVVANRVTVYKLNIDDANVYAGSSSTATDVVDVVECIFYQDANTKPGRYTALGALGAFRYGLANNFGEHWSSGLYNDAEVGADVTDWNNVSAALGGQAGAHAGYIFKSDGAGGGSMAPTRPNHPRHVTVGLSGDVDYTSIKDAIDAAIAGGANATTPWEINVFPGTYTEDPMTLVPGIALKASDNRIDTVFIVASNAASDLFTCTGGYLSGFVVSGVTDAAKCLFRMGTASTQTVFHGVRVFNCSTGWHVSNGASCLLNTCSAVITGAGQGITTWASVTGSGSYLGVATGTVVVPAAVLPAYSGNPIQTVFRAASSAKLLVLGATYRAAPKDSTADVVLADTGAQVSIISCEFADSGNALHIGSSGSNTKIIAPSVVFSNNTLNVYIESATGVVFANVSTDIERKSIVAGGQLMGMVQYRDDNTWRLIGNGKFRFGTGKDVDLTDFFYDYISTGICEGGLVSAGTGLHVDVTEGEGFIRRGAPYDDSFTVSWAAVTALSLTASATNYVYFDSTDDTVKVGGSAPGETGILLAIVVTDGSGIRFIHHVGFTASDFGRRFNQYLLDTRKAALKSGLATSQGTGVTKLSVGSGSYYLSMGEIAYAGSGGDATWSYFYGTNGATEVSGVSTLNTTQYDNAGTLTSMTAGYFRADTLYLTSDGRLSLLYGRAQYSSQAQAEEDEVVVSAPTFIDPSACRLAQVVVEQGVGIATIVDRRPQPGQTTGGGGGGTGSHSALADLDHPADHTWAMLVDGTRSMTGGLNMGGNAISNVGNVDGVDVSAHASRHNPGGSDALATATPTGVQVGATAAEGSAASYARSDHQHGISAGTPSSVGTANSAGSASTVARSDHVHNHGSQTTDTHHALAVASTSHGFMDKADKAKLDGISAGATNTPITSTAPVNVTKATAAVGTSGEAARQDHKHDVSTAIAGAQAPGDTALEGVSTSLSRSDHRHSFPAYGSSAGTICQGNDSRLSDTRTPTAHAASHKNGGSDEVATATATANSIPKTGAATTLDIGWIPTGSTGTTVCIGNDSRLSNARTPTTHASTHLPGGSDALTTGTPVAITDSTNGAGSAVSFAASDHTHSHGTRGGGTLHALTSSTAAGFMQQSNMAAAVNPTVNNDNLQGYAVGSHWYNTTAGSVWVALSVATGAAVWKKVATATWPFTASLTVDPTNPQADYTTIQAAITAASSGTVIFIAPGVYAEQLTLKDGVTLFGMGSTRYGGNQVSVSVASASSVNLLTKNSAGTAYLENIIFYVGLSGAGTVNCLNLVSGAVRAVNCLFQASITATTGTEVAAAVNNAGMFVASGCSFVTSDSNNRNTSQSTLRTSGTMELVQCKSSLSNTASNEGSIYITAGTLMLDGCEVTSDTGSQAIKRTGGVVTYRGGTTYLDKDTDDDDSPTTAASFPKQHWGVLCTDGTSGNRAYKLPCRNITADPGTPVNGDIWYNSTDAIFKAREGGVTVPLRAAPTSMAAAMARRTTTFAVTAAWQNVTYDETTVETNAAVIDHVTANKDRIQVFAAGTYLITYFFNVTPSATIGTSGRARKNDTTVLPGSELTTQNYANEDNALSVSFLASLTTNDYVSIQVMQGSGTGTMVAGASITVTKLDGMQGPQGLPGSGSTITIQEDGTPVTGTPHSTINFGPGITATNSGGGVAQAALDTYPPIGDSTTRPTAPTSGTKLFSKFRAGRHMAAQIGPSGLDYGFQPAIFANKVCWAAWNGNSTTAPTVLGLVLTGTGTLTSRTVATTNFFTQIKRGGYVSGTTAGSAAGVRQAVRQWFRGNGTGGVGGFFAVFRFGISQTQTNYRWFVGLSATTGALSNADPSTFLNQIGVGQDGTDGNIFFMCNDGAGTCTKVDLGASFPRPTANTEYYELRLFTPPNGSDIYYSLERLEAATSTVAEGSVNSNIPDQTQLLCPQVWINNNAQLAAVAIDVSTIYIETDN